MNNVKKIAVSLLILGVMTGFTQAATHHHGSKPDATLRLSTGGFALELVSTGGQARSLTEAKTIRLKSKGCR